MQRFRGSANVRQIEFAFRHEREIRYAVEEAKTAVGGYIGGAPTGHAYVADPTAVQAIKKLDELREVEFEDKQHILRRIAWPERWLTLIDHIREWAKEREGASEVFYDRYRGTSYQVTCCDYALSHSKYVRILKMIREQAMLYAVQLGLVRVF